MHMCYERPGLVTALNGGVGYDKWDRGGGGGGVAGAGAPGGPWAGRDRERDRERERQARAHQMSHAHPAEPDPSSSLFPAPTRVTGNRDHTSQQIQTKLGDYHLAQTLLDDPSKSIGIYAEPPSPAPCPPSRRESEFKKPAHAPQNGRVHHRPYSYNKNDGSVSSGAPHRPPPLRIPNGIQSQNTIDSSQPPIESILREMKSLPTPLSVIAATPRKELENKFIFNPYTNKVQENPQHANNDLKTPLPKPGLDNRISNSRSSVSPGDVNKDLGLSESDDESTRLEPIISPIRSGASPSSGSESSPSDSETESSSAESSAGTAPPPAPAPPPAQRSSWSLSNFAPPPAQPPEQTYDSGKELRHALADVKGKPSPISELSDSEASSPSPGAARRRRSLAKRASTVSSDEDTPRSHNTASPRPASSVGGPLKRGRPPKPRVEEPAKKKRGRPPKLRPPSPASPRDSDPEPDPPHHHPLQDTKTHIFRKVFLTPRKNDECGGKGGKGGKGKGGKGKGQVTIIEVTAPESGADDDRRDHKDHRDHRDRSTERRNEEAIARVSPPHEPETLTRRREAERIVNERIQERVSIERTDHRRSDERIPDRSERTDRIPEHRIERLERLVRDDRSRSIERSNDKVERMSVDKIERLTSDKALDRLTTDKMDRLSNDKMDRLSNDKMDRITIDKIDRLSSDKMDRLSVDKTERLSSDKLDRLSGEKMSIDRLSGDKMSLERLSSDKMDRISSDKSLDRLSGDKMSLERLPGDKISMERLERIAPERYVRAEADVGSGLKSGRGSERLEEASSNLPERRPRARLTVRLPLSQLRAETIRALQRPRQSRQQEKRPATPPIEQGGDAAVAGAERTSGQTPIYYSYFERLPADALSDEERDHKYYLGEAKRLRTAAEREQEPLPRVMLYLESVLCFVLTGRVLELELDTKRAFTIYRETIEYIKSIHSMPQRFRASPHSTFSKLDILSLRVQALLYLRMFKMYHREVKEYYKIVQEYQQKPACAESVSVSPVSPTPSPASVGSAGSASSGYCSLAHSVPAHAHHALLQLTKYYTFLYVAHDLWEQADCLCRLRANQDLFIAVDRKCGPLTLFSTFRHLVQYVRHAISLLKNVSRE